MLHTLKDIVSALELESNFQVRTWIAKGKVPAGSRIGTLRVWSDEEVAEIRAYSQTRKPWQRYNKTNKESN